MYKNFNVILEVDLLSDVIFQIKELFEDNDIKFSEGDDNDTILLEFFKWQARQISPQKRVVHYSKQFKTCSLNNELQAGLRQFISDCEQGNSLTKYQSRKINSAIAGTSDDLYSHWGIHHFHLGTKPDPKYQSLVKGTNEFIFAKVDNSNIYLIGIYKHKTDWSKLEIINVIEDNWPQLLEPHKLHGNVVATYDEDGIKHLRKARVNTAVTTSKGKSYILGGVSADNSSINSVIQRNKFNNYLALYIQNLQNQKQEIIIRNSHKIDELIKKAPDCKSEQYNIIICYSIENLLDIEEVNKECSLHFNLKKK